MSEIVNAIVLTSKPYRENDLLVTVLTENHNKLTIILFNANKSNSRRKSSSLPLTHVRYNIKYNMTTTFYSPLSIDIIKQNYDIYTNNNLILCTNLIIELLNKSNIDSSLYNILIYLINNINNNNYYTCLALFIKYIYEFEGILPQVEHCSMCDNTKVINFSIKQGGLVCNKHNDLTNIIDHNTLRKIRAIIHADFTKLEYFKDELLVNKEDIIFLLEFYEYHLNTKVKTKDML